MRIQWLVFQFIIIITVIIAIIIQTFSIIIHNQLKDKVIQYANFIIPANAPAPVAQPKAKNLDTICPE